MTYPPVESLDATTAARALEFSVDVRAHVLERFQKYWTLLATAVADLEDPESILEAGEVYGLGDIEEFRFHSFSPAGVHIEGYCSVCSDWYHDYVIPLSVLFGSEEVMLEHIQSDMEAHRNAEE